MELSNHIKTKLGFIRSYIIYLANPFKRKRIRKLYKLFIQPADLCFDVGAHIGIQSRIMHRLGAHVIAIEPNPTFFDFLQRNLSDFENITLLQVAISDQESIKPMYLSRMAPTVSTLADETWQKEINKRSSFEVSWDQKIMVETITLDTLISKYGKPKFIKLDIEDYEWLALKALHHQVQYISFEFFSYMSDRVVKCIQEISKNGSYSFNYSLGESFRFQFETWKSAEEMYTWIITRSPKSASGDIFARLND